MVFDGVYVTPIQAGTVYPAHCWLADILSNVPVHHAIYHGKAIINYAYYIKYTGISNKTAKMDSWHGNKF